MMQSMGGWDGFILVPTRSTHGNGKRNKVESTSTRLPVLPPYVLDELSIWSSRTLPISSRSRIQVDGIATALGLSSCLEFISLECLRSRRNKYRPTDTLRQLIHKSQIRLYPGPSRYDASFPRYRHFL